MKWAFLALVFTLILVIVRPYEGIKYNQINVYEFKREYAEKVMEVYEPEEEKEDEVFAEYLKKKYFGEKEDE